MANSRKMRFSESGLSPRHNWKEELEAGHEMDQEPICTNIYRTMNLRNSVFVDNTASDAVAGMYMVLSCSTASLW